MVATQKSFQSLWTAAYSVDACRNRNFTFSQLGAFIRFVRTAAMEQSRVVEGTYASMGQLYASAPDQKNFCKERV